MTSVRPNLASATSKAVTAWDLDTGRVIYRTLEGAWSFDLADAAALVGEAAESALEDAKRDQTRVVDPYFMEVAGPGQPAGRELVRERIRAEGPTVRRDLGRQAGNP